MIFLLHFQIRSCLSCSLHQCLTRSSIRSQISSLSFQSRQVELLSTRKKQICYFDIRFVRYKPTSLEKNYRWDLLTEHDVGVEIDLINPDAYTNNGRRIHCT